MAGHGRARADVHAQPFERRARGEPQPLGKRAENMRTALEQHDARGLRMDAAEVVAQRLPRDFGERAREFHAGRPAADDDERQQAPLRLRIGLALGGFKRQQHAPPHLQRIVQRLETGRAGSPIPG